MDPDDVVRVAEDVAASGFSHLEITSDSPGMPALLTRLRAATPSLALGAGTVLDAAAAERAIAAGASFLVSPHIDETLVAAFAGRAAMIPGAMSPTEILRAQRAGAAAIKLYPARAIGPDALRDLRGPFPAVRFVPTGSIPLDEIARWLDAGAMAVGAGRALLLGAPPAGAPPPLDRARLRATLARLREITARGVAA